MRKKTIIAAAGFAVSICAAATVGLTIRYPEMSTAQSAVYVAQRIGTLVEARLLMSTPYDAVRPLETELANVRRIALDIEPQLDSMEPLSAALALRDMVYRKVPVQAPPAGFDYSNLDRSVFLELTDENFGDICGGLSIVYLTLLKSFGIEARYVGMFKEVVNAADPVTSHASVEAFIGGQWIALDPTFNFSIWAEDERIGWEEAQIRVLAGKSLTFASDGYAILPGRSVYDYSDPLPETMKFMIFAPTPRTELRTLPVEWGGRIAYANGKQFDQGNSLTRNSVYVKLAQ
ncbi:transglutaminase domain-containing protein [Pelagibius marinus]|uniref:transglutaminase domain-containing protein n=1 Tax=Pelagibius marinus TaxID=2762760 RepID=UPI0018730775|nr:transglutaminase domain-containing protein [Pelagibius marinus]